ncbi:BCCT family transporter [Nocardioides insulae]|uniref:BCCT family transporter n=1 Tax=Nocardioides insulae TaxID=394734 RepID=UPI001B7FC80E|nr:BCCT family transporter [Nocardioides insulae]
MAAEEPTEHRGIRRGPRRIPHPALDQALGDNEVVTGDRPIDKVVFGVTASIAIGFVIWGFVSTSTLASVADEALNGTMKYLGWLFVLTASGFVVFTIWLALGKYGSIPLGRDGEEPEFRTSSWIAMMFSAGMGIGLMFFGVSEPLTFFADDGDAQIPGTEGFSPAERSEVALAQTLFHWTLHPWAIYAVVGLTLAYGIFRKGRSQLFSSAFIPLIGARRAEGALGRVIDMLAIFATLFGSAASLGLGALQISRGLEIVSGIGEVGNGVLVAIITVLTICFILSAVSGIDRGIQMLSNINMVLALILAVFVFVVGPTMFIFNVLPEAIASYVDQLPTMAGRTDAQGTDVASWLSSYTVFYWAWWISWTPFVGMFIARISRGRTVRQFVTGVLLVPSLVSLVWFAIFGGSAINLQAAGEQIYQGATEDQLFNLLDQFPWATVTSILVMVLVAIFFVSGADAASLVMGSLSQRGTTEPGRATVIFWGAATGAVAAVMLWVGGEDALTGLQNITIVASVPFVFVMIALCVSLVRDLMSDPLIIRTHYARQAINDAVVAGVTEHGDDFVISVEADPDAEGGTDDTAAQEDLAKAAADVETIDPDDEPRS